MSTTSPQLHTPSVRLQDVFAAKLRGLTLVGNQLGRSAAPTPQIAAVCSGAIRKESQCKMISAQICSTAIQNKEGNVCLCMPGIYNNAMMHIRCLKMLPVGYVRANLYQVWDDYLIRKSTTISACSSCMINKPMSLVMHYLAKQLRLLVLIVVLQDKRITQRHHSNVPVRAEIAMQTSGIHLLQTVMRCFPVLSLGPSASCSHCKR